MLFTTAMVAMAISMTSQRSPSVHALIEVSHIFGPIRLTLLESWAPCSFCDGRLVDVEDVEQLQPFSRLRTSADPRWFFQVNPG